MNAQEITLLIIVAVILGSAIVVRVVFPFLNKKGINAKVILDDVQKGLEEVKTGLEVVKEIAPNTPQLTVLELIDKSALVGVKKAQQLYISSQLQGDERKASAKETITNTLVELNIPVSDSLNKLIDDVIESKVFDSKTSTEISTQEANAIQNTITDLQKQLADLQATNANLTQTNTDLINKLNNIQMQSVVAPTVSVLPTPVTVQSTASSAFQ